MGLFDGKPKTAVKYRVQKTEAEWRGVLSAAEFNVLRKHGTERPGSSPLNKIKQAGVYKCAACAWPLYSSKDKFESGTGWPSFTRPINDKAIGTTVDNRCS
jgi:peptide-methionine (R)-S-oxide reductase